MKINKNIAVSDSGFLFNPGTGESFSLNPIGAEIIGLLKDDKSIEDISKKLGKIYEADEITIERDLYDFISMLKQHTLIEDDEQN
jgi:hypothetical protein